MKVAWLQDYDIFAYQGGAEMNDAAHFATGLRRGHDVKLITPEVPFWRPDCLIVSNCVSFDKQRISDMIRSSKTVFFLHDYIFCKYRLYYPMIEYCNKCGNARFWRDLYLQAKLLIWLSPLHRQATLVALPELKDMPYALIPSAINPDPFLNQGNHNRLNAYLSVNSLLPFKGRDNLINFAALHEDEQFHILTQDSDHTLPGNIICIPPTTYNEMPLLYRKYKYYIELPSTPQPFNRTVVEAKLSGCQIITNQLMGATSWEWFKSDLETIALNLLEAPERFWKAIEEAIK